MGRKDNIIAGFEKRAKAKGFWEYYKAQKNSRLFPAKKWAGRAALSGGAGLYAASKLGER